jgi:hypothetical protein
MTTAPKTEILRAIGLALLALVCLAGVGSAQEWADLTGKFVYDGEAPTPKPIVVDADVAEFGKLGLVDESLVVDKKTKGIANIVVYVRTKDVAIHPDLAKNVKKEIKFDNKDGRFVPRVLPLWLEKQTLCLCNSDKVPHNSNIQPFGDTGVNPLIPAGGEVEHTFNAEQIVPVPVSCNIHRWMRGYILPRANPYAAVTGTDGSFTLAKLPAGVELEFQVWQEKSGFVEAKDWKRGRFTMTLKPGRDENTLGTVKVDPKVFDK